MNSNEQFFDEYSEAIEPVQAQPDEPSEDTGISALAGGVAGAAVGAVIGSRIAGTKGAVVGAVAGAVAGGLAANAVPDDAGDRIKDAAGTVADKVKDTAEQAKSSLQGAADNVKNTALNAADRVQDAVEDAKPAIERTTDNVKTAVEDTANRVEDTADRAHTFSAQESQDFDVKERIVIEPASYVTPEATLISAQDNFAEPEDSPLIVYDDLDEIEIDPQPSRKPQTDSLS